MTPTPYNLSIHSTLGAMYIGMVVATSLHGISILQAWFYYTHQKDRWPLRTLVAAAMVCDTIHEVMITHAVYTYTVTYWGKLDQLYNFVGSLALAVLFNGLTTLIVQCFMAMRLWRLIKNNHIRIVVLSITILFVLSQFLTSLSMAILAIQRHTFNELADLRPLSYAMIIVTAAGDVFIAGAMCAVLRMSRTGFQRTDSIITKLIMFTVTTGLLTSLYALASFIAYLTAPPSFLNIAFSFGIGRLYTNTLLATLNARKRIRGSTDFIHNVDTNTNDRVTLSLHELSTSGGNFSKPSSISIKISTTKESATDFNRDEERDDDKDKKVARLQPSNSGLATGFGVEAKCSDKV